MCWSDSQVRRELEQLRRCGLVAGDDRELLATHAAVALVLAARRTST
jgi:hypothetical protein